MTNRKSLEVRVNKQELDESGRAEAGAPAPVRAARHPRRGPQRQRWQTSSTSTTSPSRSPSSSTKTCGSTSRSTQSSSPASRSSTPACASYPYGRHGGAHRRVRSARSTLTRSKEHGLRRTTASTTSSGERARAHLREVAARQEGRAALRRELRRRDDPPARRGRPHRPATTSSCPWIPMCRQESEDALRRRHHRGPDDASTTARASTSRRTAGAVVVLDAKTGGVVAMASSPSYDPRWFVRGLKPRRSVLHGSRRRVEVRRRGLRRPLLDRAYQEVYIPGSTFKPFTALAAVKEGFVDSTAPTLPADVRPPNDKSGTEFNNWSYRRTSATCPISELLRISCDTAFYKWGSRLLLPIRQRPVRRQQRTAPAGPAAVGFPASAPVSTCLARLRV